MKPNLFGLVLFFLIFSQKSIAQNNFQKGTVVTLSGDTLHGYIDEQDWDRNPSFILYMDSEQTTTKRFTTEHIQYFEVDGGLDIFQRAIVSISQNEIGLDNHFKSIDPRIQPIIDTVFLRVIEKGKCVNLYSYSDKIKTRFYYQISDTNIEELLYYLHNFKDQTTGEEKTGFVEGFKNQLTHAAMKCNSLTKEIKNKINKSKYNEDLQKIAITLNGDSPVQSEKRNSEKSKRIRNFVGFGAMATQVQQTLLLVHPIGSNTTYAPYLTWGIDMARNQNSSKFHIVSELTFLVQKINFQATLILPTILCVFIRCA